MACAIHALRKHCKDGGRGFRSRIWPFFHEHFWGKRNTSIVVCMISWYIDGTGIRNDISWQTRTTFYVSDTIVAVGFIEVLWRWYQVVKCVDQQRSHINTACGTLVWCWITLPTAINDQRYSHRSTNHKIMNVYACRIPDLWVMTARLSWSECQKVKQLSSGYVIISHSK